jgi:hypothetical protein
VPGVDWSPVVEQCKAWRERYGDGSRKLLRYEDDGSVLTLVDERHGEARRTELSGDARELYLECTQIQSLPSDHLLDDLVSGGMMYREKSQYLSLAVAQSPSVAAARIRTLAGMSNSNT